MGELNAPGLPPLGLGVVDVFDAVMNDADDRPHRCRYRCTAH